MLTAPKGLEDVSKYPKLFEELASRGLSKQELKGVAGANVLRVLKEVELTSARLVDVKPLEDVVRRPNFSLPITESPIIQQR
jgi:membrane dipeptidase